MSFFKNYMQALNAVGIGNFRSLEESGEAHFLAHYLAPLDRPVVFDVGANAGSYSLAVKAVAPTARVYAFEPHPAAFAQLKAKLAGANLFNIGLGDAEGTVDLFDRDDRKGGGAHASVYRDVIERIHLREVVGTKVQIRTLDKIVEENNVERIALLKIDTEGHELAVFRGAEKTLRGGRIDAIQFEFNATNVMARTFFKDFWDLLPDYTFFRLLPKNAIRISSYIPAFCEVFAFQNIVCLRNSTEVYPNALELPQTPERITGTARLRGSIHSLDSAARMVSPAEFVRTVREGRTACILEPGQQVNIRIRTDDRFSQPVRRHRGRPLLTRHSYEAAPIVLTAVNNAHFWGSAHFFTDADGVVVRESVRTGTIGKSATTTPCSWG